MLRYKSVKVAKSPKTTSTVTKTSGALTRTSTGFVPGTGVEPKTPATNRGHRWLIGGVTAIILSLVTIGILWAVVQPPVPFVASQKTPTPPSSLSPTPIPEPSFTVLLMGRGGAGHDGGTLTDTILLARILLEQKRIILLSIPRDLWVHIPYDEKEQFGKINSAYAIGVDKNYQKLEKYTDEYGGGNLAKDTITSVTGLQIDKYVAIDFSGFETAIDSIGGVEVQVQRAFTDYEYPIAGRERADCSQPQEKTEHTPTSIQEEIESGKLDPTLLPKLPREFPCRYEALRFVAGKQTLSGKTALKYVRSRHSSEEGNDFARSNRQKILLTAVSDKLFSLGHIAKVPNFLTTLRSHLDTDLLATDILSWTPKANELRSYPITSLALTMENYLEQGYTEDRQFVLRPIPGIGKYDAIQNWIQSSMDPTIKIKYPTIEITASHNTASQAASLKEVLLHKGYPARIGSFNARSATTSATLILQKLSIDEDAIRELQEMANVSPPFIHTATSSGSIDIRVLLP